MSFINGRNTMSSSLTGQRVVVLGGTSGIGLATARAAIDAGAEVVVASSRQSSVDAALAELSTSATGHAVDVLNPESLRGLFAEVGAFDHLVYTAGEPLSLLPARDMDVVAARRFFEVRYFGALTAASIAASSLRAGGSITFTSGSARVRPGSGWSVAASICGAMTSLTKALAVELAPLRVNVVEPGIVRSPLWSGMTEAEQEGMFAQQAALLPAGRVGEVSDVAQAFVYAMSQSFVTGTSIPVDGGALLV